MWVFNIASIGGLHNFRNVLVTVGGGLVVMKMAMSLWWRTLQTKAVVAVARRRRKDVQLW